MVLRDSTRPAQPTHHSTSSPSPFFSSSNFAAIVGFLRVSFLMVTSWALSLARRRLRCVTSQGF